MMYRFNLKRFILFLLPVSLRGNILSFISVLCSPFSNIYYRFLSFREKQFKTLSYSPQYPHLQRLLNDEYDNDLRRVKVHDGEYLKYLIVYPAEENKPLIIRNLTQNVSSSEIIIIHNSSAYEYPNPVMELPVEFNDTDIPARIDRVVNKYKFTGIRFNKIFK